MLMDILGVQIRCLLITFAWRSWAFPFIGFSEGHPPGFPDLLQFYAEDLR
jgi:hypothetical protein